MRKRPALWLVAAAMFAAVLPRAQAAPSPDVPGRGQDVSWPQCAGAGKTTTGPLPADAAFGIVGTSNGTPNTANPCLAQQYAWAAVLPQPPAFYFLPGNPGPDKSVDGKGLSDAEHSRWQRGSLIDPTQAPRPCSGAATDDGCAYDYGWQAALNALANVDAAAIPATPLTWWLDVEPPSYYRTANPAALAQNVIALDGSRDALLTRPDRVSAVGIYAAPLGNWKAITNSDTTAFASNPYWYPVGDDGLAAAVSHCNQISPAGGIVTTVQWTDTDDAIGKTFDQDLRCAGGPTAAAAAPVVVPLKITYAPSLLQAGATANIRGTAQPGASLSVHQAEVNVPEHQISTVLVNPDGSWSTAVTQSSNGYVTVFDANGGVNRKIAVTTKVTTSRVTYGRRTPGGQCLVRLDGAVDSWRPGQVVSVQKTGGKQIAYAHTRQRGGTLGSWSVVLKLACGKALTVTPTDSGRSGGVTYAQPSRGLAKVLKPRP